MPPPPVEDAPLILVHGDDDFAVRRRAKQLFQTWLARFPGGDEEILDATAANSDEALKAVARLREALQTLPFFGGTKTIWFRDCNFVGEDRVSEAQAVLDTMAEVARELAAFQWSGVRLLVSAGRIDRRRTFAKTLEKIAAVEHYPGLSSEDRDWQEKAENLVVGEFKTLGKRADPEATSAFVEQVGANARQIASEAHKLAAYVGDRDRITLADVEAIVTRGRHARAFALGDAVGERQLGKALRHLDEELWALRSDKQKSEIGLLYGLIGKVRAMLLAKELVAEGLLRPGHDYGAFAAQVKSLPADRLPTDKRYNPREINAYVLFRAAQHSRNYSREELVQAMEELLQSNRRLVGSSLAGGLVLQMALTRIVARPPATPATPSDRRSPAR